MRQSNRSTGAWSCPSDGLWEQTDLWSDHLIMVVVSFLFCLLSVLQPCRVLLGHRRPQQQTGRINILSSYTDTNGNQTESKYQTCHVYRVRIFAVSACVVRCNKRNSQHLTLVYLYSSRKLSVLYSWCFYIHSDCQSANCKGIFWHNLSFFVEVLFIFIWTKLLKLY